MVKILKCPDEQYYFEFYVNPDLEDCEAIVQPRYKVWGDASGITLMPGRIGFVCFKGMDALRMGIISHEAVHCASTYMRVVMGYDRIVFKDEIDDYEEDFADLVYHFAKEMGVLYYDLLEESQSIQQ